MASKPLPEIKEADATGLTAAIYDDIRAVMRASLVNLIFRNMATVPGCLEWAWTTIRPVYISGIVGQAAAALTSRVLPSRGGVFTQPQLEACGLGRTDIQDVDAVLDAYGRANPMNLIGLKIIDLALDNAPQKDGTGQGQPLDPGGLRTAEGIPPLIPMTDPVSAPSDVQEKLLSLSIQIHKADTGVIPSLYRHFGKWPKLLDLIEAKLEEPFASGDVDEAALEMRKTGEMRAAEIYSTLPLPSMEPPDEETKSTLKGLINQFPPNICRMTVLATLMRRGLK